MTDGDVAFLHWPSERLTRARLADDGVPRLLLVEPGASPPDTWAADEDWIRIPADPFDLHQRTAELRRRCAPAPQARIDDDGLLWRGEAWVALAPVELALMEVLVGRMGRLVRRAELERSGWAAGLPSDSRVLDRAISRVRAKLHPLDLAIRRVPGAGYVLETACRRAG